MSTENNIFPKYKYRADIYIDGELLPLGSFVGLHESWRYMDSMYVNRILMINVSAKVLKASSFLETNYCKITIEMYQITSSDESIPKSDAGYVHEENMLYSMTYTGIIDQEILPFSDEEVQDLDDKEDAGEKLRYVLRFHLISENMNPFIKDVYSGVMSEKTYPSCVVADAFTRCAAEDLNLYMDPQSEKAIVPAGTVFKPQGFIQLINKLQSDYGLFGFGYNIFIEENTVFVLSKDGGVQDDATPEPSFIIRVVNPLSANVVSKGYRNGYGNVIVTDSTSVVIDDSEHIYYKNTESRITESGKIIHPSSTKKNVSLFVNNEDYVSDSIVRTDENVRMQNIHISLEDAYFDVYPYTIFQIESTFYTLRNLTIRNMNRIITQLGCVTNIDLMRKLYNE